MRGKYHVIVQNYWLNAKVVVEEIKGIPNFKATAFPRTAMDIACQL